MSLCLPDVLASVQSLILSVLAFQPMEGRVRGMILYYYIIYLAHLFARGMPPSTGRFVRLRKQRRVSLYFSRSIVRAMKGRRQKRKSSVGDTEQFVDGEWFAQEVG